MKRAAGTANSLTNATLPRRDIIRGRVIDVFAASATS
jgi:hypothetical protein